MADPLAAAYATLGLAPGASPEEIKRAWRRVARATHPDLNPDDPDAARRFKAAEAAHALLTDPERARRVGGGFHAGWSPGRTGPDDDWIDACAWIAEAHLLRLRVDVLPRYATRFRGGPSLVAALAAAVDRGLAEQAPPDISRFGRLWSRSTWRRLELLVDEGPPQGLGPVGLLRRGDRVRLVVWPRALWAEGVRDDDTLRAVVRKSVDLGVTAAAPMVLGVARPGLVEPGADRAWWAGRLLWPTVWVLVALLSLVLLGASWRAANQPRFIREHPMMERAR